MTEYRSSLGQALGLGSGKAGSQHWWMQRLTALALLPLSLWLAFVLPYLWKLGYFEIVHWVQQPLHAVLLAAYILCAMHHAQAGLQVVIEDYVPHLPARVGLLLGMKAVFLFSTLAALLALARMAT